MNRFICAFLTLICLSVHSVQASGPAADSPQEDYIRKYAPLAVEEMYRTGVPASITLAQGLLESRYGLSELAVKGNNHFGIKCHNNWKGRRMYYDDDRRNECFRKYSSPEESYRDHSDFLRYRDRYKFLFDFRVTDYKAWARGLKKAGYATDPAYPSKLIDLIEKYDLHEYDRKPASFARDRRKREKRSRNKGGGQKPIVIPDEIPESPAVIESNIRLSDEQRQEFHFSLTREVYSRNGVPFVRSVEGETYSSIAAANNLFEREIRKFNDSAGDRQLAPGTEVYLKPKRNQAVKGLDKHVVEDGETMWSIAQRYGIKLKSLYKMNGMTDIDVPREGDIIKLRKK